MQQISKQFGAAFADALALCPTLVNDLKALRAAGIRIRRVGGHCQAYSIAKKQVIYIGSKCKLSYQLISLAHEKVHVLDNVTPDPVAFVTSRQQFINLCLDAETDAIVHEVQVVSELLAAGIDVDEHSLSWHRRFKKGGRAVIRKAMETATTSNTGELYPEYYGLWYDEALKPAQRLPLRSGKAVVPAAVRVQVDRDPCPHFPAICATGVDPIMITPVDPVTP